MTSSVVIADDHPIFRRGLRDTIDQDGRFRVVAEASTGVEAIAAIRLHRPALAVLDISMPEADGLEVLKQARGWPEAPAIIILSMHDDYVRQAFALGALGYMVKENTEDELIACMEAVLEGRRFVSKGIGFAVDPTGELEVVSALAPLSPTERRVLKLIAALKSSREIGQLMSISHRTVQNHRAHMCLKLNLRGDKALLRFAMEHAAELDD